MTNDYGMTLEECDRLVDNGYCVSIKNTGDYIYLLYSENIWVKFL